MGTRGAGPALHPLHSCGMQPSTAYNPVRCREMNPPNPSLRHIRARLPQAILQILGFAGTSHLLHHAVALLPRYAESKLAESATLFSGSDPQALLEALFWFALIPALLEELLFRGVLFAILERLRGACFAITVSALLFGIAHLDPHHAAIATVLGLQLGLLRYFFGLRLAIAAHLLNNALALFATYLSQTSGHGLPPFQAGVLSLSLALLVAGSAWAVLMQRIRSIRGFASGDRTDLQTPAQRDE